MAKCWLATGFPSTLDTQPVRLLQSLVSREGSHANSDRCSGDGAAGGVYNPR